MSKRIEELEKKEKEAREEVKHMALAYKLKNEFEAGINTYYTDNQTSYTDEATLSASLPDALSSAVVAIGGSRATNTVGTSGYSQLPGNGMKSSDKERNNDTWAYTRIDLIQANIHIDQCQPRLPLAQPIRASSFAFGATFRNSAATEASRVRTAGMRRSCASGQDARITAQAIVDARLLACSRRR